MKGAISCRDCKHCLNIRREVGKHWSQRKFKFVQYSFEGTDRDTIYECGYKRTIRSMDLDAVWHQTTVTIRLDYKTLNGENGVGFCPFYKNKGFFQLFKEGLQDRRTKTLNAREPSGTDDGGPW